MTIAIRNLVPERMDDPALDAALHHDALSGLARVNRLSGAARMIWRPIERLARQKPQEGPLTLLDVACGGGDVTVRLAQLARRAGLPLRIRGCDISTRAIAFAQQAADRAAMEIDFFAHDAVNGPDLPASDIVISSLFLHHLPDEHQARTLARMAAAARRLLVVHDLRRCRFGLLLARLGTRVLSRSPVVHFDGPQSVRAALTDNELRTLALEAGLIGAVVRRCPPFRMQLEWRRP